MLTTVIVRNGEEVLYQHDFKSGSVQTALQGLTAVLYGREFPAGAVVSIEIKVQ